jgi:hypothetical protein
MSKFDKVEPRKKKKKKKKKKKGEVPSKADL